MENKEIYIDGVDVSGCEYFRVTLPSGCLGGYRCNCDSINTMSFNCEENNCIYKQLKRKEQECEELEEIIQLQNKMQMEVCEEKNKELDQLKAEIETLKQYKASKQASYESMQREWNNAVNENRELKAENENWQKEYWKLEQGNDFLAETNSRLKQTLTEIKPILELYANSKIGEEQPDGTYKYSGKYSGKYIESNGLVCINYDPRPAREGLKKISECEV